MGIGRANGEGRAEKAARLATTSPLLDMSIEGATGVLYNIVGSNLSLTEISMVSELIKEAVDPSANIKFGAQISDDLEDEIVITIVATGIKKADQMYSTSKGDEIDLEDDLDSSQTFTGFTTPNMEKQLKEEDDSEDSQSSGGLEFNISQGDQEDEEKDQKQEDETEAPYEPDSKDPLDVPAFMRKKDKK
jgi:cell division GTPase FtsZ